MSGPELHVARDGHVVTLTLDRPARRNALSTALTAELVGALVDLDEDDDVWAIVLTGEGDAAFCAGTDLKELDERARRTGRGPQQPMRGPDRNLFETLVETRKPTIAVVNGPAMGAGFELALACDLRIAADHATMALPEVKRGMGANFGSIMLPRLLPRAVALELLYTGAPLSPQDALRWGLVNDVVSSARLRARAAELVASIVANAPLTLRRYKEMTTKGWELPLAHALRLDVGPNVYRSRDREEGVRAFVEHRAPRWEGR
ncbi:MAG TPA: enoyl-CoA hydratase-related protein [Baekduia sp.]